MTYVPADTVATAVLAHVPVIARRRGGCSHSLLRSCSSRAEFHLINLCNLLVLPACMLCIQEHLEHTLLSISSELKDIYRRYIDSLWHMEHICPVM